MITLTIKDIIPVINPTHTVCDDLNTEFVPSDLYYTTDGLRIKNFYFYCDNPKLQFAKALNCFMEEHGATHIIYEDKITCRIDFHAEIGGPGFGFVRDETGTLVRMPQLGEVFISKGVEVRHFATINRATTGLTYIGENVKIDHHVHVAHNCYIGKNTWIAAGAIICGSVKIGENCDIGAGCVIKPKVKIGNRVIVGAGAVIVKDVDDGAIIVGNPGKALIHV